MIPTESYTANYTSPQILYKHAGTVGCKYCLCFVCKKRMCGIFRKKIDNNDEQNDNIVNYDFFSISKMHLVYRRKDSRVKDAIYGC